MTARRVRFRVAGRVQGVGFRAATQREAVRLGLVGHVQNEPDRAVTGEAEGDAAAVEALVAWLRRGPWLARVDALDVVEVPPVAGSAFEVRR